MFAAKAQLCGQESAVFLQPSPFFVLIIGAERSNAQRRLPLGACWEYLTLNMGVWLKLLGFESFDNIRTDPSNPRKNLLKMCSNTSKCNPFNSECVGARFSLT